MEYTGFWEIRKEFIKKSVQSYISPVNIDQTKGSILISSAAAGRVRSNLVVTSGWTTPIIPITLPRRTICAHL